MFSNGLIQITLIQIDNYGRWTSSLGYDREDKLQILQASLYTDVQRFFSSLGGIAFFHSFDTMMAVTNGIDEGSHRRIQSEICSRYPISVSMSVGVSSTAYKAQRWASEELIKRNTSPVHSQRMILINSEKIVDEGGGLVQIAHFDVDDSTKLFLDTRSAYDAALAIDRSFQTLAFLLKEKEALLFFCGGDNFISPCNGLSTSELHEIITAVYEETGVKFKVGVGLAQKAREALKFAAMGLDEIRAGKYPGPIKLFSKIYTDQLK